MFHLNEVQALVSAINIRMDLYFYVANNVVPVEDILDMHNVDDVITEEESYNAGIWCYYIAWDLKICLVDLNEVNNSFTCMDFFTQVCHKITKSGIFEIINGRRCKKGMPCL